MQEHDLNNNLVINHPKILSALIEPDELALDLIQIMLGYGFKIILITPLFDPKSELNRKDLLEISYYYQGKYNQGFVAVTNENNITKYIVYADLPELVCLKSNDFAGDSSNLAADLIQLQLSRKIWFSSVVAAMVNSADELLLEFDFLYLHNWEMGLVGRILKEHYANQNIKCLLGLYNQPKLSDNVLLPESKIVADLKSLGINLFLDQNGKGSWFKEAILGVDHILYGTKNLFQKIVWYDGWQLGVDNICKRINSKKRDCIVDLGINNQFDPCKIKAILPEFDLSNLVDSKLLAKVKVNDQLSQFQSKTDLNTHPKSISAYKPLMLYINNNLSDNDLIYVQSMVRCCMEHNINLLVLVQSDSLKVKNNLTAIIDDALNITNIVFLVENLVWFKTHESLIRFAADFIFISPNQIFSWRILQQAQLQASLAVIPNCCGLECLVTEGNQGSIYAVNNDPQKTVETIKSAILRVLGALELLTNDRKLRETKLQRLYNYAAINFLWSGSESSLRKIMNFLWNLSATPKVHGKKLPSNDLEGFSGSIKSRLTACRDYPIKLTPEILSASKNLTNAKFTVNTSSCGFIKSLQGDIFVILTKLDCDTQNTQIKFAAAGNQGGSSDSSNVNPQSSGEFSTQGLNRNNPKNEYLGKLLYSCQDPDLIDSYVKIVEYEIANKQQFTWLWRQINMLNLTDELLVPYISDDENNPTVKYIFKKINRGEHLNLVLQRQTFSILDKILISINIMLEIQKLHHNNIIYNGLNLNDILIEINDSSWLQNLDCYKVKLNNFNQSCMLDLLEIGSVPKTIETAIKPADQKIIETSVQASNPKTIKTTAKTENLGDRLHSDVYAMGVLLTKIFNQEFQLKNDRAVDAAVALRQQHPTSTNMRANSFADLVTEERSIKFAKIVIPDFYKTATLCLLERLLELIEKMLAPINQSRPSITECLSEMQDLLKHYDQEQLHEVDAAYDLDAYCQQFGFDICDLNKPNSQGVVPIVSACNHGRLKLVKQILDNSNFAR